MFWDTVSGTATLVERLPSMSTMHRLMLTAADIGPGHSVLDLGCGAGSYFTPVRTAIGDSGHLTGLDFAAKMVARARRRVAEASWANVEVIQEDATSADLGEDRYDAIFAMYSFTAMPDPAAAIRNAHRALRPGGRMFVADVRLVPSGRAAPLIRLFRGLYRVLAGATGDDIIPDIRATFGTVDIWDPNRNEPTTAPLPPWPPLLMLVATK